MTPVAEQIITFLVTVILGLITGLTFDLYETLRKYTKPRKVCTALGDFLVWVIITTIVFAVLFYANWGEVRFYVFIGLGGGVLCYKKFLSPSFLFLFDKLFLVIFKILFGLHKISKFILKVFLYPVKIFKKPYAFLKRKLTGKTLCLKKFINRFHLQKLAGKLLRKLHKK